MKAYVHLGSVLALAVSALAMPSTYYSGHYCCPKIVHEHSVIEPTHDCNVQVSIVTDWGNCTTLDKGFWWYVNWNDGTIDEGCTDHLSPFGPLTHKYPGCGDYEKSYKGVWACVFVWYCNSIASRLDQCSHEADCCDMINKCVVMY